MPRTREQAHGSAILIDDRNAELQLLLKEVITGSHLVTSSRPDAHSVMQAIHSQRAPASHGERLRKSYHSIS
jgi:hypothetical protein